MRRRLLLAGLVLLAQLGCDKPPQQPKIPPQEPKIPPPDPAAPKEPAFTLPPLDDIVTPNLIYDKEILAKIPADLRKLPPRTKEPQVGIWVDLGTSNAFYIGSLQGRELWGVDSGNRRMPFKGEEKRYIVYQDRHTVRAILADPYDGAVSIYARKLLIRDGRLFYMEDKQATSHGPTNVLPLPARLTIFELSGPDLKKATKVFGTPVLSRGYLSKIEERADQLILSYLPADAGKSDKRTIVGINGQELTR